MGQSPVDWVYNNEQNVRARAGAKCSHYGHNFKYHPPPKFSGELKCPELRRDV